MKHESSHERRAPCTDIQSFDFLRRKNTIYLLLIPSLARPPTADHEQPGLDNFPKAVNGDWQDAGGQLMRGHDRP